MNTLVILLNILYILSNAESLHPLIEAQKDLQQFEVLMRRDLGRTCGWWCCGSGDTDSKCTRNADCDSGWCEGFVCSPSCSWSSCVCKPKRGDQEPMFGGDITSCASGEEICGTCVGSSTGMKLDNGKDCSRNVDCVSDFCEGGSMYMCNGICRARLPVGYATFEGDSNSCESRKDICDVCASDAGKVPNGIKCSENGDCESGWCLGCPWTIGCSGICTAGIANYELAHRCVDFGWRDSSSCASGESNRCVCTAAEDKQEAPLGTSCDKDADCALPNFCKYPDGQERAIADYGCIGTCEECPAELGCGYLSCHTYLFAEKISFQCGRKTFGDQFGGALYSIAENLIAILDCFMPGPEGFATQKSCSLDALGSAAKCLKPGEDCSIVVGKPKGDGGCLEFNQTWTDLITDSVTFKHETTLLEMEATLGYEAEYYANVKANALAGVYFTGNPRVEAVITPPALDVTGRLKLTAEASIKFKGEEWTDRRFELADSMTLVSQLFMVGAVPLMVKVEAVPVAYVTIWGETKASAEFEYTINGLFSFKDDIKITFSLTDGKYQMNEWTPNLLSDITDSWTVKLDGSIDCGIRVVTGVDLTVMVNGVSMRITPAVVGEVGLKGNFTIGVDGTIAGGPTASAPTSTGYLKPTLKIGADMKVQFSLTPFVDDAETAGSTRRSLQPGGKYYHLQQMALEYQKNPVAFMKQVALAEETGVSTSIGEYEYEVGASINIFTAMQFQCEKFAKSVGCDAVGALCKTVIDIFKKFGWDGEITIPDLGWDTKFTSPMKEFALKALKPHIGEPIKLGSATALDQAEIAAASEEEIASWNLRERYNVAELRPYEVAKESEESVGSLYELYEAQIGASLDLQTINWEDAAEFYNEFAEEMMVGKEIHFADVFEDKTAQEEQSKESEVKSYSEEKAEAYLDEEAYTEEAETVQSEGESAMNEPMLYGLALIGLLAIMYFAYIGICSGDSVYQKYEISEIANDADSI